MNAGFKVVDHELNHPNSLSEENKPAAGQIYINLYPTKECVYIGATIHRQTMVLDKLRQLSDLPELIVGETAGTFAIGGPNWLGISALGKLPYPGLLPIDWMACNFKYWLEFQLKPLGIHMTQGKVVGAWCPGFSDLAVNGRKLVGTGLRVTRDWILMRGVMAIASISQEQLDLLNRCHRLIGLSIDPDSLTSLAELTNNSCGSSAGTIRLLSRDVS